MLRRRGVVRTVTGIAVGCALAFVLSAMADAVVFHGGPPEALPVLPLAAFLLVMNGLAAIAGGYTAAALARRRPRTHGLAVGISYVLLMQLAPPSLTNLAFPAAAQPLWFTAASMAIVLAGAALGGAARDESGRQRA
ncbi:MAG: DUF3792 family protein [Gemmatimonadaceae bacterium]|nr:DUF3792 family protein [Gemmatimonadaceae bacterium]